MGWELFRRDSVDGFEMVGVEGDLLTEAPLDGFPIAVEISVAANSTLPESLSATEQAIASMTERLGGVIAGTVRSARSLWTLVHLPTDEEARQLSDIPLPPGGSLVVSPAVDPDWTIFGLVRPVGIEEQSMSDLRVMSAMHARGDRGGVRRIVHVVTGLDDERSASFTSALESLGFDVRRDGGDSVELLHEADPAHVTDDAWTIRQIAERHGATYDGWSCPVAGDEAAGGRRRWWTRR